MPFYEYECTACKFYVEVLQKISDEPLRKCPSCKKQTMKRLMSAPAFRLKGEGWYETDFKSDQEDKRNLAATEETPEAKPEEAKATDKAEKPAEKPAEAKPESGKAAAKAPAKKAPVKAAAKPARKPAPKAKPAPKRSAKKPAKGK